MVKHIEKKDLCIIHVGMHKTGSSSIQNFLYTNVGNIEFKYANLKVENQSKVIYSLFSNNPYEYHGHKSLGLSKEEVNKYNVENRALINQSFLNSYTQKTIISAEDIMYLKQDELIKFKVFLSDYFFNIKIIAYVRPLLSYVESAFQELVKHGLNRIDFTYADPDYKRFLLFYDVFGKENVTLRFFHKNALYNGDVLQDFCKTIGISNNLQTNISKNESLSKEAISLLYVYQKYTKDFYKPGAQYFTERNLLINTLKKIGKTKFQFSTEFVQEVIEINKHIIPIIEKEVHSNIIENRVATDTMITSESDLLQFDYSIVKELHSLLNQGDEHVDCSPENVAKLVNDLNNILNNKGFNA